MPETNIETKTRSGLVKAIAIIGGLLILGMLALKVWFASTVFMADDEDVTAIAVAEEPLDPQERIAREMVTPTAPGTPVMPDADFTLNPTNYSRELARFIPIEVGMDRYAATDELLLHYNANGESGAKVSSSERMIDGATLFVIRRSGMADDSVSAEETFALFDDAMLVDFGSRQQCARGATPNQWTTELCP